MSAVRPIRSRLFPGLFFYSAFPFVFPVFAFIWLHLLPFPVSLPENVFGTRGSGGPLLFLPMGNWILQISLSMLFFFGPDSRNRIPAFERRIYVFGVIFLQKLTTLLMKMIFAKDPFRNIYLLLAFLPTGLS